MTSGALGHGGTCPDDPCREPCRSRKKRHNKMQFSIENKKAALDLSPRLPMRRLQRGVLVMRTSVLAEVDLNQLRLGLFALRKSQRQHAVLVLGMDLFRVNGARQ